MQEAAPLLAKRKRIIRNAGLMFFILVLLLTFFSRTINNLLLPEVDCRNPYNGKLEWEITASGEAKALEVLKVQSSGNWKIIETRVKEGDKVAAGEVLAVIDGSDALAELKKLELELQSLEIDQEKYKNSFTVQELPAYEDAADKAFKEWKAGIENYDDIKALYEVGAETEKNLEGVQNKLLEAEKEYKNKTALIEQKKTEYELTLRQKNIQLELKRDDMENLKSSIPQRGEILSPIDGVIISAFIEKGSVYGGGQALLEILGEDSPVVVQWLFSTVKADALREGDPVEITAEEPEAALIEGRITEKKYLSSEGMFQFTASPDNTGSKLQNGIKAEVRAVRKSREYPILVPNSAVIEESGRNVVFVLKEREGALGKENHVEKIYVKVEESDDINSAITGAVSESDNIIVYSTKPLSDGMQVKLR